MENPAAQQVPPEEDPPAIEANPLENSQQLGENNSELTPL